MDFKPIKLHIKLIEASRSKYYSDLTCLCLTGGLYLCPKSVTMKYLRIFLINVIACLLFNLNAEAQDLSLKKQVWPDQYLMQTKTLVQNMKNPKAAKPLIYNIGFVSNIQGAKKLVSANKEEGLAQLRSELKNKPKTSPIVIYCGCCPFEHCPNVSPAFTLLQKLGYTNAKILNLPTSIKADWIDKGYPMAK